GRGVVGVQAEEVRRIGGCGGIRPAAGEEIAVLLERSPAVIPLGGEHQVALAIGKGGAEDGRGALLITVTRFGRAELRVDLQAFEIPAQQEVRYTADGVGTIGGRCTA